jgi:hypothetical protein
MKKLRLIVLLTGLIPSLGACNNGGSSTTAPAAPTKTDTFTGTVQVLGSDSHNFTEAQAGEVDVSLTAAGPPATISMAVAVGNGGTDASGNSTCSYASTSEIPLQAAPGIAFNFVVNPGTYCVNVRDYGNATQPVSYIIVVAHS